MVRKLVVALAVVAMLMFDMVAAAHADTPCPNVWVCTYQQSVFLTGDSLTMGALPYETFLFDLAHRELQQAAWWGVTIPQMLPLIRGEVAAAPMPPTAVIALGGNDTESLGQFMWYVEGVIDTLPPTERVIWVNFYSERDTTWQDKNSILNYVVSRHPNATVLDWASIISQHPEMITDGVHYTPDGYVLRALTIGAAV